MDVASIATTLKALSEGTKAARELIKGLQKPEDKADVKQKINKAAEKVGDVLDSLYGLREELFRLQDENRQLKTELTEIDAWKNRLSEFELIRTPAGAVVYKSLSGLSYFACPRCIEHKELYPLQKRGASPYYDCPKCGQGYEIDVRGPTPGVVKSRPF